MFLLRNKSSKKVSILMLVIVLTILALNISTSYAESEIKLRAFDCGQCGTDVINTIDRIFSRTDTQGNRCPHCTRSSSHSTDVYTVRRVLRCSRGCTYQILEHMPTEYKCR